MLYSLINTLTFTTNSQQMLSCNLCFLLVATHLVEFYCDIKFLFEEFISLVFFAPFLLFRMVKLGDLVSSMDATLRWLPPPPVPLTPKQRLRLLIKSMSLVRSGRVNFNCHWNLYRTLMEQLSVSRLDHEFVSSPSTSECYMAMLWCLSKLDWPSSPSRRNHIPSLLPSLLNMYVKTVVSMSAHQASTLRHFGAGFSSDITGDGPVKQNSHQKSSRKAPSSAPSTPRGSASGDGLSGAGGSVGDGLRGAGGSVSVSGAPLLSTPGGSVSVTGAPLISTPPSTASVPPPMQSQLDLLSQSVLALTQLISSNHQQRLHYSISPVALEKMPAYRPLDFDTWKIQFRFALPDSLSDIIDGTESLTSEEHSVRRNRGLYTAIVRSLTMSSSQAILNPSVSGVDEYDGLRAWRFLVSKNTTKTWMYRLKLHQDFLLLQQLPHEASSAFVDRINLEFERVSSAGALSAQEIKCLIFLRGSLQNPLSAPTAEEILRTLDVRPSLDFDDLARTVHNGYLAATLNHSSSSSSSSAAPVRDAAFKALQSKYDRLRSVAKEKGVDIPKDVDKSKLVCSRCGYKGHSKETCVVSDAKVARHQAQLKAKQEKAKMARHSELPSSVSPRSGFIRMACDSGCSSHMVPHTVSLNGLRVVNSVIATASGSLRANFKGSLGPLQDVLSVYGLNESLFSVSSSVRKGLSFVFDQTGVRVFSTDIRPAETPVFSGVLASDGLFYVDVPTSLSSVNRELALVADVRPPNLFALWHARLGHPSRRLQKYMFSHGLFAGVRSSLEWTKLDAKKFDNCLCEGCVKGKQTMAPISRLPLDRTTIHIDSPPPSHSPRRGRLVAVDLLCSPVASIGNFNYAMTFTDADTHFTWVSLLRSKDQVSVNAAMEAWVQSIRLDGVSVDALTVLRSDNGKEFVNNLLADFLRSSVIRHEVCPPYHHVALAERTNRSLQEIARSCLFHADLPSGYWNYALTHACHLLNISPCNFGMMSRYEAYHGRKPEVSMLRVFGCVCWVKVYDQNRKMWDTQSQRHRFLGLGADDGSPKTWKVVNLSNHSVTYSGNVIFDETTVSLGGSLVDSKVLSHLFTGLPQDAADYQNAVFTPLTHHPPVSRAQRDPIVTRARNRKSLASDPVVSSVESASVAVASSPVDSSSGAVVSSVVDSPEDFDAVSPVVPSRSHHADIEYALSVRTRLATDFNTPSTLRAAQRSEDWDECWLPSLNSEVDSLVKNNTLEVIRRPSRCHVLPLKWVFKIKADLQGNISRFKTRCTVMGNLQLDGIDYNETFAPVFHHSSFRCLMAYAALKDLIVHHLDVDTAFLYGELPPEDPPVYVDVPFNYPIPEELKRVDPKQLCCRVRKGLYGLKQSPRLWNKTLDSALRQLDFTPLPDDPCIYRRGSGPTLVYLAVYVDDLVLAGATSDVISSVKSELSLRFNMKDLGPLTHCLGMEVRQDLAAGTIHLNQRKYTLDVLRRFGMAECKSSPLPMPAHTKLLRGGAPSKAFPYPELIGSLLYLSGWTRPDIAFSVNYLSRFLSCHDASHHQAALQVLRYLKGSPDFGITYSRTGNPTLKAFSDSDWASDIETRRSVTGFVFLLAGGPISWSSKCQPTVALSSTEAEYMALAMTCCEGIFLKRLLGQLGLPIVPLTILGDNQSSLALVRNPVLHSRTKHIDIRHHFIRELWESGQISLDYCPTFSMYADCLTKPLATVAFLQHRSSLCTVAL